MRVIKSYRLPLVLAIGLHVLLLIILVIKLPAHQYRLATNGKSSIVHATTLSSKAVHKAMHEIEQRETLHERKARQRLVELRARERVSKRRQREALAHVAKMRTEQLRLKRAHEKQLKSLAVLKHQQARLKKLAAERAAKAKLAAKKAHWAKLRHEKLLAAKRKKLMQQLMAKQLHGDSTAVHKLQAAQLNGIVNKYKALILAAISQNWLVPGGAKRDLSCVYVVDLAPGGVVISAKLVKSSGNSALDASARTAIYKSSPLPVPKSASAFNQFRHFRLTVSPKALVSG